MVELFGRVVVVVLAYYLGTRGLYLATQRFAGKKWRRALMCSAIALLFTPSVVPLGAEGGWILGPAWFALIERAGEGRGIELLFTAGSVVAMSAVLFTGVSLVTKKTTRRNPDHEDQAAGD